MLDRRLGILMVGVTSLIGYGLYRYLSPTEIEFTAPAPAAGKSIEMRAPISTAQVELPFDLQRVARRAEDALAQRLSIPLETTEAACGKRAAADCGANRQETGISPAGNAQLTASGNVVRVRLPLKVEVGQGGEKTISATAITFGFKVIAGGGLPVEVTRVDEPASDPLSARAPRVVEVRLRPLGLTIQDELRAALSALPVQVATERAWGALMQPIDLGSGNWLRAAPEVAGLAEIVVKDDGASLRIPIATRIAVEPGEPGGPSVRHSVIHGQVNTAGGAIVRAAVPISLLVMQPAINAAFVGAGSLETRPDRFGPAVKVDVRRTRIYPSLRQIAVELDLKATRFEGQVYPGKAHLQGRPVLDADRRVVTLADVSFTPVPQRDAAAARRAASAPRLANDPFAGMLASTFKIDVARDASDVLPRVSAMLQRRLGDRLSLTAQFSKSSPVAFEVTQQGGQLLTDLSGELTFVYEEAGVRAVVAKPEQPVERAPATSARKMAIPEIAPAAVTPTAASTVFPQAKSAVAESVFSGTSAAASDPTSAGGQDAGEGAASGKSSGRAHSRSSSSKAAKSVPSKQASTWIPFPTNN